MLYPFKTVRIRSFERGLHFHRGELIGLLPPGKHTLVDFLDRHRIDVLSTREPWIQHGDLDLLVGSGVLGKEAVVVELSDRERALVKIDGRLDSMIGPGRYALWSTFCEVEVERFVCESVRFEHSMLDVILGTRSGQHFLEALTVPQGQVALVYDSGELIETLGPGRYAFWKGLGEVRCHVIEARESVLDLAGQELMTSDKVTLRMNAVVSFRVKDVRQAVSASDDFRQALYREAQLVLRTKVGNETLDELLAHKSELGKQLGEQLTGRAEMLGVEIGAFGIRDLILPGDMKELLNKVTEARKAAEASVITRREETAAIRSQLNTAKLMESNPTLMRLRELETLERIATGAKLSVVVGEKGLAENVLKLV